MDILFLHPWVLSALASLPVIWFLLRIMPPRPMRVVLPTLRFLHGLSGDQHTPSHTPWWLLLLRLMIAGLIIGALAGPIYKPAAQLSGSGTLRIVMGNSWASAQNWDAQLRAAKDVVKRAGRQKRAIYVLSTAPSSGAERIVQSDVMTASQALTVLNAMEPLPWAAAYKMAAEALGEDEKMDTLWFGNGLNEGKMARLAQAVLAQGMVTYLAPEARDLPIALRWPDKKTKDLQVEIMRPAAMPDGRPVTLQVLAENGRVLDQQSVRLSKKESLVTFTIPEAFQNDAAQVRIVGNNSAGAVLILDENAKRRHVGIVAPREKAETQPFIEASYYLKRALEPYTSLQFGTVSEILQEEPSLIILSDIGVMPPESLDQLDQWVHDGGVLVRYAGPNMVEEAGGLYLVPVEIRSGGRAMDGAMTWEDPVTIAPFDKDSPFYGVPVHEDILVRRQILAEPSPELEEKVWARLSDDTPLITAAGSGDGMLVLIHTSATPAWSDLAISGVYVDILRRLVALSGQEKKTLVNEGGGSLDPIWVLDGFGKTQKPDGAIKPIAAEEFTAIQSSSQHPPGLYGRAGYQGALNLGDGLGALIAAGDVAGGVFTRSYNGDYERDLMPLVLLAAMGLFLLDWIIMLVISGGLRMRFSVVIALVICFSTSPLQASAIEHSNALYLAYIKTGDARVDAVSRQGLGNLSKALGNRTSAEPAGVVGLDLGRDDLAFFPVIYWPVTKGQTPPSSKALDRLQHYLDHGGTILIDKRLRAAERQDNARNLTLQSLIGSLNIPPMQPIPGDHVLGKSFYLLEHYPGLYSGDTLWVEKRSAGGRDGVSSVIIGSHDWASAWASAENGRATSRQYELSLRFGVNLMMYGLTGNYKADQVHLPAILERLGE